MNRYAHKRRFCDLPVAQQAGILCNEPRFQQFAGSRAVKSGIQFNPQATAEFLRVFCGIASRRDLNTNAAARDKFNILRTEFDAWTGRIPTPR